MAQITNEVRAHIDHSFIVDNTTLPPGDYTFQMMQGSNLSLMTVSNDNDKTSVAFIVRESRDNHTPAHSEVVFRKYGNTEFLDKIYETGTKIGVSTTETGREEQHLLQQGQHPTEETEDQK